MTRRRVWAIFGVVAAAVASGVALASTMDAPTEVAAEVAATLRWCGEEQAGNRELADQLRHRARELDERDHSFDARKKELAETEKRLDARMAELTALRTEVAASLDRADKAQDERVKGLVKMVESNRAASIAPMFAGLDEALAVEVLDRMNRQKAGKLLAALPPAKAAALADKLTRSLQSKVQ